MPKYRVPIRVSVAPVQTYAKTIEVEASSRKEAANIIAQHGCANSVLSDAINSPGWKPVGGRLDPIQPHLTPYDTYLAEDDLATWAAAEDKE